MSLIDEIREIVQEVAQLLDTNPRQALERAEAATRMATESGDPLAAGLALRAKGAAFSRCYENQAAVECFDESLKIFEEAGEAFEATKTRMNRINAYMVLSRFDEALADSRAVTAAYREAGEEHRLAKHLINTGAIFFRLDRFQEDLECLDQAEMLLKRIGEVREIANVYLNRAVTLTSLNQTDEALDFYVMARQAAFDHNLPAVAAQADYNICYLYFMRGQYSTALDGLSRVQEKMVALGDRWHVALCDLDRAEIYLKLNLHSDAFELASAAKTVFEALPMRYEAGKATVLMAVANSSMGKASAARSLFEEARRIFEADQNGIWLATVDLYEVALDLNTNQQRDTEQVLNEAFDAFKKAGLHGKAVQAALLCARSSMKRGAPWEALQNVARAQGILDKAPTAWLTAEVCQVAGDALESIGDQEAALHVYTRGIHELECLRGNIGVDYLRSMFFEDKLGLYESLIAAELKLGRRPSEVFDTVERAKSRTLLDHVASSAEASPDASTANVDKLRKLREELNWHYKRFASQEERIHPSTDVDIQWLAHEIRRREEHFRQLLRDAPSNAKTLQQTVTPFKLEQIQSVIPTRTRIVEYFEVKGKITALVVSGEDLRISEPLCSTDEILRICRLLSFQINRMATPPEVGSHFASEQLESTNLHLSELYGFLIRPLEMLIDDCDALVLVPHGFLHHVPLHAAFDGTQYLIDKYVVTYAPSASVFRSCMLTSSRPSGGPLVVGLADRRSPWTEHEARQVADLFTDSQLLLGATATQANVFSSAPSASIVHIASHGRFRPDNAIFSSIELSDTPLSLFDISRLRLSAQLVVLSGCSTGMSTVLPGDEQFGLARGFLYAGCPAVVASLWNVNDLKSAELMVYFYRNLMAAHTKGQSLQLAMKAIRKQSPHPYYWAPFVLLGKSS